MFSKLNSLAIVALFAVITSSLQVDAGLIHIYHKYRSKPAEVASKQFGQNPETVPLDGQTVTGNGSLVADESMRLGSGNGDQDDEQTTTAIEFSSPMKRIMELIGNHPPLIVVSSSSSASGDPPASDPFAGTSSSSSSGSENLLQSVHQQPAVTGQPATSGDRQHWTILDPSGQMLASTATGGPATQLATQQQQLYQSTVPFEQYYIATPNDNNNQQQFAVLPAFASGPFQQVAGGFPFASHIQPFQLGATGDTNQQQQQQQSQLIQQTSQQLIGQSLEADKAQPIFLSSYVPEVPLLTNANKANEQPRPDSIQQVQYAQVGEQKAKQEAGQERKSSPVDESDSSDEGSSSSSQDVPPKEEQADSDEPPEEASKTKRSNAGKGSEGAGEEADESPGSGSMSYENKFDSDKDEQPRESVSLNGVKKVQPAETSNYSNGLVSTGLDDTCLQCICRASSGCDASLRCITRGAEDKYCGPFQLTEEYWNMAGSPGDEANSFISFEDCSNNEDCATETVVNYMKKYLKDCDDDGQITCMDYARLHRLKPDECDNTDRLTQKYEDYWTKFQHCAENYNRTRDGDDEHI